MKGGTLTTNLRELYVCSICGNVTGHTQSLEYATPANIYYAHDDEDGQVV